MKIGAVITLLTGVVLGALAVVLPLALGIKNLGMTIGLGVGGLTCIIVGVVLWIFAAKMSAMDQLLTTGVPATAVIKAARETGISMRNGMFVVLEFNLEVSSEMQSPYQVTCRSTVPRISLSMVGLEKTVAVRVDPADRSRVAIDWSTVPS